jgi:HPt (histidine-containing phosphotransfer) domain-containing protein
MVYMKNTSLTEIGESVISADVQVAEKLETEILDYEALLNRCMGNMELASRLLVKLETCLPEEIESMEKALAMQDAEQVARIAHRVKGALLNISARRLAQAVEEIESLGKMGRIADIPTRIERLRQEWEQFEKYYGSFLAKIDSTDKDPNGRGSSKQI